MAGSALIAQGIDRRRAILRYVKKHQKDHGFAPSIEEIATAVQVTKTAVRHHLDVLKAEGWVTWVEGKYRSLKLLKPDVRY